LRIILVLPGIILLILGAYLVFSAPTYNSFSLAVGLSNNQVVLDRTSVFPLRGSNYSSIQIALTPDENLSATIQSNPSGIDFLLTNAGNYSLLSERNNSAYQVYSQSRLGIGNYSFSFATSNPGNYYLVFVSHATSTDVLVHISVTRTTVSSTSAYVPILIVLAGVVLIAFGSILRRPVVVENISQGIRTQAFPATSSKCQFCGARIDPGSVFCPSCKKSQQ
jgi:hypothetical protein